MTPGATGFGVALDVEFLKNRFGQRALASRFERPRRPVAVCCGRTRCYGSPHMPLRSFPSALSGRNSSPVRGASRGDGSTIRAGPQRRRARSARAALSGRDLDFDASSRTPACRSPEGPAREFDPRNATLEAEYYKEIDLEKWARVKPLLWFWQMFDHSPVGRNVRLGTQMRAMLAARVFRKCGKGVRIFHGVEFSFGYNLTVGDGVTIHRNVLIDDRGEVVIGDDASISDYANIYSHAHAVEDIHDIALHKTVIGDRARVTYHSVVLSGVGVEKDAIVGLDGRRLQAGPGRHDRRRDPRQADRAEERQRIAAPQERGSLPCPPWSSSPSTSTGPCWTLSGLASRMGPIVGPRSEDLLGRWRKGQLERSWRLNHERRYEPWDRVTAAALEETAPKLAAPDRSRLCELWLTMPAFPDAATALGAIHREKVRTAILSNGTRSMIEHALEAAGLSVDAILSADDVRAYKTDPRVYALLDNEAGRGRTLFASANGWDADGAKRDGRIVAWIDRGSEAPATPPTYRVTRLSEVADIVRRRPTRA